MSNYNCPNCGNAIVDSPGGPEEIHSCIYMPTHDELIEMGFKADVWEGVTYSYDFQALSWHPCDVEGQLEKLGPHWRLSSWYQPWFPRSKEDVLTIIRCYDPLITSPK